MNFYSLLLISSLFLIQGIRTGTDGIQSTVDVSTFISSKKHENAETFQYKAETSQLMDRIVNHLYVHKQVCIRELLANACDAIDKLKLTAGDDHSLITEVNETAKVVVRIDKKNGTLIFSDNGIGMSHDDLRDYLGTIAKSGTSEMLKKLKENTENLIGQFGVGFYSAFLIGEKVLVISKSRNDPKQWIWVANANEGSYEIFEDPRGVTMEHGTEIIIKIKPEDSDFLDHATVRNWMQTFASYFPYPIIFKMEKTIEKEVEEPESKVTEEEKAKEVVESEEKPKSTEEPVAVVESEDEDKQVKTKEEKKKKTITEVVFEDVQVNEQKPLWLRDPKTVEKSEYIQMYRTLFRENEDPLIWIQFSVEGSVNYRGVLFIPKKAPFDIYSLKDAKSSILLYVRRSFVTDKLDDILPVTLSFVKGIVDSDDLPLNISRETLQNTVAMNSIKHKLVGKLIEMCHNLSRDPERVEDWKTLYKEYSNHFKYEIARRENLRSKLANIICYESNKSGGNFAPLDDYISRKKPSQKHIYYITGMSRAEVIASPFMERMAERDLEVLYAVDPIDEQTLRSLGKYQNLTFQNIAQDGFRFEDEESKESVEESKKRRSELETTFKPLSDYLLSELKTEVERVNISERLVKSPFAVVANQFGLTGHTEKLMMSQRSASGDREDPMLTFLMSQKKILEINPEHQTIKMLLQVVQSKDPKSTKTLSSVIRALYDSALMNSGFPLKQPKRFAHSVEKLVFEVLGQTYDESVTSLQDEKEEQPEDPLQKLMKEVANEKKMNGDFSHEHKAGEEHDHDHNHEHDHEHDDHESEGELESENQEEQSIPTKEVEIDLEKDVEDVRESELDFFGTKVKSESQDEPLKEEL